MAHILMIHVPKQLYFSQSAFGVDLVVERITDLLDSHLLAGLRIDCSTEEQEHRTEFVTTDSKSTSNC
jgi:hypothetical protein